MLMLQVYPITKERKKWRILIYVDCFTTFFRTYAQLSSFRIDGKQYSRYM